MCVFYQRASLLASGAGSAQIFCKDPLPRTLEQQLQEYRWVMPWVFPLNIQSPMQNDFPTQKYKLWNSGTLTAKTLASLDSSRRGSNYRSSLTCKPTSTSLSWQKTGTHPCRITPIPPSPAQHSLVHLRPSVHSWSLVAPTQRCTLCPQTVRRRRLNKEAVFWWSEAHPFPARHTEAGSQKYK